MLKLWALAFFIKLIIQRKFDDGLCNAPKQWQTSFYPRHKELTPITANSLSLCI